MDYIGSKLKLNDWIFEKITKVVPPDKGTTFLDACCGSGVVSRHAAFLGYNVVANDLMKFPSVIASGSIGLTDNQKQQARGHIMDFNNLSGIDGYFYRHFCSESVPSRMYFTAENARLIDHVRSNIEKIQDNKVKDYLLYCGIEALSRVNNTAGVQAAYLKKFKKAALKRFFLKEEISVDGKVIPFCMNILSLLKDKVFRSEYKEDVLYIDPPYNHRQYGPNYHLYETFVKNDNPKPLGITGLRDWKNECKSEFCTKKGCLNFTKEIVKSTTAKYVFISYNSDGIVSEDEFKKSFPKMVLHKRSQRRFKSDTSNNRTYNVSELFEYLIEIPK